MSDARTGFVSLQKINIAYSRSGPASGSCFLFLHGLQSNKDVFAALRATLHGAFPHMPQLALDFAGFGESEKPEGFSYDLPAQAGLVTDAVQMLGMSRAHIIGHSRGGMTGTLMLKTAPHLVQSLISLEGNLVLADCGESRTVARLPYETFRDTHYPALKQKLAASKEPSALFRHAALQLIPDYAFYRTSTTTVAWSENGLLAEAFRASPLPRLMVCGASSAFASRDPGGNADTADIPSSGHFMLLDNPAATAEAVTGFLTKRVF